MYGGNCASGFPSCSLCIVQQGVQVSNCLLNWKAQGSMTKGQLHMTSASTLAFIGLYKAVGI